MRRRGKKNYLIRQITRDNWRAPASTGAHFFLLIQTNSNTLTERRARRGSAVGANRGIPKRSPTEVLSIIKLNNTNANEVPANRVLLTIDAFYIRTSE